MKKIFSIFMIMAIVILLSNSVFCYDWGSGGGWWDWWQNNNQSTEQTTEPTADVTTEPTPEVTPEVTPTPTAEPTTTTVVQNDTTTEKPIPTNIKNLPKTGEDTSIILTSMGLFCIMVGVLYGIGRKILGNKNVN